MTAERYRRRGGTAAAAAPSSWASRLPGSRSKAFAAGPFLRACLLHEIERRRLFPWIAVAFGAGVVLASVADGPVSPWPPLCVGAGFAAGAILARAHLARTAALIGLAALCFGFAAMAWRTLSVEAPVLSRLTTAKLEGIVESVEERLSGGRLVVKLTSLGTLPATEMPARVRVSARALDGIVAGDAVAATARLLPLPEPARPGGFDFARDAYYRGLGAVGSISGKLVRTEPRSNPGPSFRIATAIDRGRNVLTRRIADSIGGQPGAVAAALVTGKRGLIDDHSNDILRAAGIYHIVSISGLHMVLAAGAFFSITRALLALSPTLALTWPIKKIAAAAGMLGATAYDIFSGSDVATERSLVMILVMQGAILFDRPALSIRNLAVAALLILAREPETLLGPSFQMSFAAVAGLIALAEWMRAHRRPSEGEAEGWWRIWRWLAAAVIGTVATTLVATVATGPFSTYHFGAVQPYGIVGNAATLPLVSVVVMPGALIGTLLYPFGLDRPVWTGMGWGVDGILRLSEWIAGLSGSVAAVPVFGAGALALLVSAILLATLCVSALRWLAIVPACLGVALAATTPRPDVYVARDGGGAAVRGRAGRLVMLGKVPNFEAEQWLRADGDARRATEPGLREGVRCDRIGCVAETADGRPVSLITDRRGFAEDCARVAILVSRLQAPAGCKAERVVDGPFLREHGATTLRTGPSGFDVATARVPGETRPWFARPPPSRQVTTKPAQRKAEAAAPVRPARESEDGLPEPSADLPEAERE